MCFKRKLRKRNYSFKNTTGGAVKRGATFGKKCRIKCITDQKKENVF